MTPEEKQVIIDKVKDLGFEPFKDVYIYFISNGNKLCYDPSENILGIQSVVTYNFVSIKILLSPSDLETLFKAIVS